MPITFNRNAIPVFAIVAAAGLTITACTEEGREEATTAVNDAADATGEAMSKAGDAAKDAAADVQDAAVQAKDQFVETANEQLENLETQVDEFIARARENMPDASSEVNRLRDELNNAVANAKVQLEKVRNAGADGWKAASEQFDEAIAQVRRSFDQLKEQFSGANPEMPG